MLLFASVLVFIPCVFAQCFFRNGELAIIGDQSYVKCPSADFCCLPTDICGTNGLCRDVNNHADGSLTDDGTNLYNFTGLYQTPACSNSEWTGCETQCSSSQSSDRAYIWSCNDQETEYCCLGANDLYTHRSCCSPSTNFELTPVDTSTSSTSSMSSMTSTSSGTSTGEATSSTTQSAGSAAATATASANPDSGLSTGAKAGIGAGVAGGVLALAALVGLLWFLRRKRSPKAKTAPSYAPVMTHIPSSSGDHTPVVKSPAAYSDWAPESKPVASPLAEMDDGRRGPSEMAGDTWYSRRHQSSELA